MTWLPRLRSAANLLLSRPWVLAAAAGAAFFSLLLFSSWRNWREDSARISTPVTASVAAGGPIPASGWTPAQLRRFKKRHRRPDLAPAAKSDALGAPRKPDLTTRLGTHRILALPPLPPPARASATPISELSRPCLEGGTASAGLIREADGSTTQSLVVEAPRFFDFKARRLFYLEAMAPDLMKELWRAELGMEYRLVRAGRFGLVGKLAVGDYALQLPDRSIERDQLRVSAGFRLEWE